LLYTAVKNAMGLKTMTLAINSVVRYLRTVNDMLCNVPITNSLRYAARSIYQISRVMIPMTAKSTLAVRPDRLLSRRELLIAPELLLLPLRPHGRPWYEKVTFCLMEEL
jgi:hypothetical protein